MNHALYQIAYTSRKSPSVTDDQIIDDIALPAYRKNRILEITGCLWFDTNHFVQWLEGPERNVREVYGAILRDSRHHDIRELLSRSVTERSFWRFALQIVRDSKHDPVRRLVDQTFATDMAERPTAELLSQIAPTIEEAMTCLARA